MSWLRCWCGARSCRPRTRGCATSWNTAGMGTGSHLGWSMRSSTRRSLRDASVRGDRARTDGVSVSGRTARAARGSSPVRCAHRQVPLLWAPPSGPSTVSEHPTLLYLIAPGRGYEHAAEVLGEDFSGVLERDGWAPYRRRVEQARNPSSSSGSKTGQSAGTVAAPSGAPSSRAYATLPGSRCRQHSPSSGARSAWPSAPCPIASAAL